MKRYWDYTEKERSEMTEEQVKALLDVELMEKGVLKVELPILAELEPVDVGHATTYYQVGVSGPIFATLEQATAFLALEPLRADYHYQLGSEYKFAEVAHARDVEPVKLYGKAQVEAARAVIERNKSKKDANEQEQKDYEKAVKAVNEATGGVWSDWYSCQRQAGRMQKVMDTLAEYERLTEGNREMAIAFLNKAFNRDDITAAHEWFGKDDPFAPVAVEASPEGGF